MDGSKVVKEEVIAPKLEPLSPVPSPPPSTPPTLSPAVVPPSTSQPVPFIKPEYSLVPVRSGVPIYYLIHRGPAPPGWETDPSWQENKFNIDEPIFYKNEYFRLQHNTGN